MTVRIIRLIWGEITVTLVWLRSSYGQQPASIHLRSRIFQSHLRRLDSAANSISLPNLKPRATCEPFVVPPVRSRNVALAEWPYVRRFEHFLQLLDVIDDAFNVH